MVNGSGCAIVLWAYLENSLEKLRLLCVKTKMVTSPKRNVDNVSSKLMSAGLKAAIYQKKKLNKKFFKTSNAQVTD